MLRPPAERASFVAQLSGADDELKRSVERLLATQGVTDIGARSTDDIGGDDLAGDTQIGQYRIEGVLGRGGMGVVYRATDTKLRRPVAIKFLATAVADPDVRRRFEREARTTSALNHPHIVTVHDVGEHEGRQYIVSELVDGGTLDDSSTGRRRTWRQAVELLTGVADALAAAHVAGVLHRDVKPGNILVGSNGYAKLADFGLAKLFDARARGPTDPPLGVSRHTRAGVIVGTVAYMSPEQAAGQPLDARSDVFSFGVVLYELLAGRRPFDGANDLEALKAITHATPEPLPDDVPELLRMAIDKALEKDPGDRYQTMQDLVADLKRIARRATSSVPVRSAAASRRSHWPWLVAAGCALAFVVGVPAALLWRDSPPTPRPMQFDIAVPDYYYGATLSADGSQLAYVALINGVEQIWTRQIDGREAQALSGTEDVRSRAFWSHDGGSVAFFTDEGLKRIGVAGGAAQTVAPRTPMRGPGTWGNDDTILFATPAPPAAVAIGRVAASGGEVALLTTPEPGLSQDAHIHPRWLPDGEHFIYLGGRASGVGATAYVGSVTGDEPRALFRIEESQILGGGNRSLNLAYASGFILYFRDGTLMAQPFDAESLMLRGEPRALLENVGEFSVGGDLLVYREAAMSRERERRLTWRDRTGRLLGEIEAPRRFRFPVLSPDARLVAVSAPSSDSPWDDIWTIDERGARRRLTLDEAADHSAVWSPDGERVAFASSRNATGDIANTIYVRSSSGAEPEQQLFAAPDTDFTVPHDWSRDHIVFHRLRINASSASAFWVLPLSSDEPAYSLLEFSFPVGQARVSPDGRWIAYPADESDGYQIIVQPFPNVGDGKWQVSTRGGFNPRWRDDGLELYYVDPDGTIMVVDVEAAGSEFEPSAPRPLFDIEITFPTTRSTFDYFFDVAESGQRFLVIDELSDAPEPERDPNEPTRGAETLHVIVNWAAKLSR